MGTGRRRSAGLATIVIMLAVLAAAVLSTTGCGASDDTTTSAANTTTAPSSSQSTATTLAPSTGTITQQQVVDLVDLTSAAIEKDAAGTLKAINAAMPPYTDAKNPELYAFVYDTQVTLIATPDATVRGQNMKGKPDAVGSLFRDEIVNGALANGSGWVEYVYKQPGKDGLFQKATLYKLATGNDGTQYVVCVGRYLGPYEAAQPSSTGTTGSSASSSHATQAQVQAFVEKAVAFAGAKGKDAALAAFTAPGGEFHQGELYIYAYDFSGIVLAHGGDAKLVGQNLLGMKDPNGVPVIQELVALAKQGGGWLYYTWPNPQNGNREEPKLGYVMKVDDTWFLGSGTYGPAAVKPAS